MSTRAHHVGALDGLARLREPRSPIISEPITAVDLPPVRPVPGAVPVAPPGYVLVTPAGAAVHELSPRVPRSPLGLRLAVTALALVFVVAGASLAVEHVRPAWLDFARHVVVASRPETTRLVVSHRRPPVFKQLSATPTGALYEVPARSYSIVVEVGEPVWTVVESPPGHMPPVLAKTLLPAAAPTVVAVHGDASVVVDARAESISIRASGRVLGTIGSPRLGTTYTFRVTR